MSAYVLLCNFTDQGIRGIKEGPSRRAAAREMAKKLGVEVTSAHLAMGTYDLIIHAEAASDDVLAKWALSLASKGNLRTNTVKVFSEAETDKILAAII
jgi:uncharacterized protein with GYD domain